MTTISEHSMEDLIEAVIRDDTNKVQWLLESGCDPNAVLDDDCLTALHFAAQNNSLRTTPLLLTAGANVHAESLEGITPIDVARLHQHGDMIKLLISCRSLGGNTNGSELPC